jgi:peptide/nickel transport system ATP-binding protein
MCGTFMGSLLLDVDNLTTRYHTSKGQVHALENVCFSLDEGQSIGIAGESACGKSTLGLSIMRMFQRINSFDNNYDDKDDNDSAGKIISGKIIFDSDDILSISKSDYDNKIRWKKISMIFQGAMNSLDPVFTIKEQFIEILNQHKSQNNNKTIDIKDIHDLIYAVGLDIDVLKKYPHELSGGMKQRIIIAMALLLKPKFVIADEPTTALDVLTQAQIINLLKKLKRDGMSIMIITHDLAILSEIADMIGIMYGGQIVEFGSLSDVYTNPKHPYTQSLLASIPVLKGSKPKYIKGTPPNLIEPVNQCMFIDRCPKAMPKCKNDPPNFKTNSGYVKCWLYE